MGEYLRWTAVVLAGLILSLVLRQRSGELGVLLTLAVCTLVGFAAIRLLEPVTELLGELERLGNVDREAVSIMLKAAGIALISELAGLICSDAGENAMGKALQILSNGAILWLSLPLLKQILSMIGEVLTHP